MRDVPLLGYDLIKEGVILIQSYKVVYVNRKVEEWFGSNRKNWIGISCEEIPLNSEENSFLSQIENCERTRTSVEQIFSVRSTNATVKVS